MSKRNPRPLRVSPAYKKKLISNKHMKWRHNRSKDQNNRCYFCYVEFHDQSYWRACTLDHFLPLNLGGEDHFENTVACCKRCNNTKGDLHPADFPAAVAFTEDYERRLARITFDEEEEFLCIIT